MLCPFTSREPGSELALPASGHFALGATMFSFLRRVKPASDQTSAASPNTNMLSFEPSSIVRAITFHLLDEGKARAVDPESTKAAVHKLSQRMSYLRISAAHWAAMDNGQRLQWLLTHGHVVVKSASSRPAMLFVRRWPALDAGVWSWR